MGLIVDTSVLISAERKKFDLDRFYFDVADEDLFMSAITVSEMWHGYHRATGVFQTERLRHIQKVEASIPTLEFSVREALIHARIWARLEEIGQRIGLHDLLIAATAIAHDHSVATLNEAEFQRVPDLRLVPVRQYLR